MRDPSFLSAVISTVGMIAVAYITYVVAGRNNARTSQESAEVAASSEVERARIEAHSSESHDAFEAMQAIRGELKQCNAELLEANRRYFQVETLLQLSEARRVQVEQEVERLTGQLAERNGEIEQLRSVDRRSAVAES